MEAYVNGCVDALVMDEWTNERNSLKGMYLSGHDLPDHPQSCFVGICLISCLV